MTQVAFLMTHPVKGRGFDDPRRFSDEPPSKGEGDRSRQDAVLMTRPAKGRAVSSRRLPDDPLAFLMTQVAFLMTHPVKGRGFDDPSRHSDDPPSKGEGA